MNETLHLTDDYDEENSTYLLSYNSVTMETTVINSVASTDWSEGSVWSLTLTSLERKLFYSKCV